MKKLKINPRQEFWIAFGFLILFYLGMILWKVLEQDFTGLVITSLFTTVFIFWYMWFVTFKYVPLVKNLGRMEGALAILKRNKKMLKKIIKFMEGVEERWKKK